MIAWCFVQYQVNPELDFESFSNLTAGLQFLCCASNISFEWTNSTSKINLWNQLAVVNQNLQFNPETSSAFQKLLAWSNNYESSQLALDQLMFLYLWAWSSLSSLGCDSSGFVAELIRSADSPLIVWVMVVCLSILVCHSSGRSVAACLSSGGMVCLERFWSGELS